MFGSHSLFRSFNVEIRVVKSCDFSPKIKVVATKLSLDLLD